MIRNFNVSIPIDTESELYARLEAEAQRSGTTVDAVVDKLIVVGAHWLLSDRLKAWEALRK